MKNKPLILYGSLVLLLVLALMMWFFHQNQTKFDWDDQNTQSAYRQNSQQPWGTAVLHQILGRIFPEKKVHLITKSIASELPIDTAAPPANFVFIGAAMFLDSADTRQVVNFAAAGNRVFLSCKTVPYDLMFYLYETECPNSPWEDFDVFPDTAVVFHLEQPQMTAPQRFEVVRRNMPVEYYWHYIPDRVACEQSGIRVLGWMDSTWVNCMQIPVGKGWVILHSNPIVFTNYFLLREEGKTYAEAIFSHLLEGDIFWDDYSHTSETAGRNRNQRQYHRHELPERHALTYILKQKSLAWGWYLLVILSLLWVFFRAKRRQRVVPVLPKNENTSLEFINAIANLQFQASHFGKVLDQNMGHFLNFLRDRYSIHVPLDAQQHLPHPTPELIRKISRVSEVPELSISDIFQQYAAAHSYQITEQMMVDFHLAVEDFLQRAK